MGDTRKRSSIWLQFLDLGDNRAECLICEMKISRRAGSTTNLHRHLRVVHPSVQLEGRCLPSPPPIDPDVSYRKQKADEATANSTRKKKKKQTRRRSSIWQHFRDHGNNKAHCQHCKEKLTFRAGSTTNLHRHMRIIHPAVDIQGMPLPGSPSSDSGEIHQETLEMGDVSMPAISKISLFIPKQLTHAKQHSLDLELAKMITRDFQRFSIVEDHGFQSFIKSLNPTYNLPNKKTLSQTILPQLYDIQRSYWQERVRKAPAVCLTVDYWTAKGTHSFMSVSCHFIENYKLTSCLLDCFDFTDIHTTENLAEELLRVAREWEVEEKVVCCVTDSSPHIITAVLALKWTHQPCLAHLLDQMVRDSLKVVQPIVDKVKAVVEFFNTNTVAAQMLTSTQCEMGMPEVTLKQDCASRWISTYHMFNRILETKDAIISTLVPIYPPVDALCEDDWELVKEVCTVLQLFVEVTVEMSLDSYVPASKMLLLCKGLQRITARHQQNVTTQEAKELAVALCSAMDEKFLSLEYNTVLSEATLLDPRFKKLAFNDDTAVDEAVLRISAAAATWAPSSQPEPQFEVQVDGEPQASVIWMLFDERATGDAARRNPAADAQTEVRSYLEECIIQRSEDPLSWWQVKAPIFPRLAKVMEERLCIVATSLPPQRLFSKTGQTLSERRNRICPSNLRHMTFLNANLH